MGHGIVYCESCGERLLESDFQKGHAVTVLNKNYCSKCRPESADAAPGHHSPAGGTKLRPAIGARGPKPDTTRSRKISSPSQAPVLLGGLVVVVALGLMGWLLFRGDAGATPLATAKPSTPVAAAKPPLDLRKAQDALKRLQDLAALPSTSADDLQKEIDRTRPLVQGTRLQGEFEEVIAEAGRRRKLREEAEGLDAQLRKVSEIRAADREFGRREEVLKLLGQARQKAAEIAPHRKAEVDKAELEFHASYNGFCQERYDQTVAAVDILVRSEAYQDAITTIERAFPPHLRDSSYWPDLERRINQYKIDLQRKAAQPAPTPSAEPPRPALAREDMPPIGKAAVLFDGKSMERLVRYVLPGEKEEAWRIEKGELVGESTNPSTDATRMFDPILTRADGFEQYELEFEAKVEKGNLVLIGRFDDQSRLGGFAQIQAAQTASWTKFTFTWSDKNFTGSRDGGQTVELKTGEVGRGRVGFALQPGTKAFLRNVKITPKN